MKIKDIYNLPRQSSYDIEKIFTLKDLGRSIFPTQNYMGVDWQLLKQNVPGLQAFKVETNLNIFFIVSLSDEKFILVNYDKVAQYYVPYCTNQKIYNLFMKLLIAHSNLSYCHFTASEETNILFPDDEDYYKEFED
jgi:hypothetical protein